LSSLAEPEPFVRPIRIPESVPLEYADPPIARVGERGTWTLRFTLAEPIPGGERFGILFDGGRNVKGAWRPLQADDPQADGFVAFRTASGANIAVVDYYDAQGRFIGYKYIQNVLADIQIEAVRRLDNENRAIYREMRKLSSIMDDEKKQMAQIAGEHARLDARLDVFNRNRENYRKQHSPPKRSPETTAEKPKPSTATPSTQEDENLERKLLKLKEMFDKGLIPEKLYETKVAAALDNYLGLKRGDDADEKP